MVEQNLCVVSGFLASSEEKKAIYKICHAILNKCHLVPT